VLLVTSRWHFTLPGLAAKNLDTLTVDDSRALLLAIAPRIGPWADEIAKLCGYLPLALRLAAGALAKYRNLKPADYARRLQDAQQRLQLIEASLTLSYELLSEELQERWRWLAVFPDSFAEDAAAAVWEVGVDQTQPTLGELLAASLVEWNETTGRYRLHDLARLFADAKLSAEERAAVQKRHATHYMNVLSAANDLYLQGGAALAHSLVVFDLEWSNIQTGHIWVVAQDIKVDEYAARLGIAYPAAGADLLDLRHHPRERIHWLEIALAAARQWNDRPGEGATLGNLGLAYAHLGETQRAIESHEQRLAIAREIGDQSGEGKALGNLGVVYADLGETQRAIQFFEQRLRIARELRDRRAEGNALNNLGGVYAQLGETERAIEFFEQRLAIAREIGDRRGEGSALNNLGNIYYLHREPHSALQFYGRYLTIVRDLGDQRGEGTAMWNMSLALHRLGKFVEAIQHAAQALMLLQQIEDPLSAIVRAKINTWREESG